MPQPAGLPLILNCGSQPPTATRACNAHPCASSPLPRRQIQFSQGISVLIARLDAVGLIQYADNASNTVCNFFRNAPKREGWNYDMKCRDFCAWSSGQRNAAGSAARASRPPVDAPLGVCLGTPSAATNKAVPSPPPCSRFWEVRFAISPQPYFLDR